MAVITIMKKVKEIHPEEIALVKVGNFYQVFGKDSFIICKRSIKCYNIYIVQYIRKWD